MSYLIFRIMSVLELTGYWILADHNIIYYISSIIAFYLVKLKIELNALQQSSPNFALKLNTHFLC